VEARVQAKSGRYTRKGIRKDTEIADGGTDDAAYERLHYESHDVNGMFSDTGRLADLFAVCRG